MGSMTSNTGDDAMEESTAGLTTHSLTMSHIGAAVFVILLIVAVYIFALTQLIPPQDVWLSSLISFRGHYGEDVAFAGISYIELLEASGLLSFFGLFIYSYERKWAPSSGHRALFALSLPLKVFGTMIAALVYTETHLLWGELWYGVKLLAVYPQGFPWGNERVASNLCFLHGNDYVPSYGSYCWFLNYDELLYIAIGMIIIGLFMSRKYRTHQASASD